MFQHPFDLSKAPPNDENAVEIVIAMPDQHVTLTWKTGDTWFLTVEDVGEDAKDFDPAKRKLEKMIGTAQAAAIMALLVGLGELPYNPNEDRLAPFVTEYCYEKANEVFINVPKNLRCIP